MTIASQKFWPVNRLRKVFPSLADNIVADKVYRNIERNVSPDSIVLNVGCGEGGEGISAFSTEFLEQNMVGCDIRKTDFTAVLADGHHLPYRDESVDAVICQAVLSHVEDADAVIDEILRVLKPGGYLFIDVPFIQGYQGIPHDYRRFTLPGLESKLSDLDKIRSGVSVGPTTSLLWIGIEYVSYLLSFGNGSIRYILAHGLRVFLFWVKYVDRILLSLYGDSEYLLKIPSSVYWYGRKP